MKETARIDIEEPVREIPSRNDKMQTLTPRRALIERFYDEARSDLVGLWQIVKAVERKNGRGEDPTEDVLSIVRALLGRGLRAGDPPYSEGGFRPWPDQNVDVVLQRIRAEWLALGRTPDLPDIAWFYLPR